MRLGKSPHSTAVVALGIELKSGRYAGFLFNFKVKQVGEFYV